MITILITCDAIAFKSVQWHGFHFAASGLIFPFSFFIACILTEVYGYRLAGRIIWVQLCCSSIFIVLINLLILPNHTTQHSIDTNYFLLYHCYWRVILSTALATPTAYFVADLVISKIKVLFNGKLFILRYIIANIIGKLLLVSISYPINYYHLYPILIIFKIILDTWLFKIAVSLLLSPIAIMTANKIKKAEHLDFFDYGISYNPVLVFNETTSGINHYEELEESQKLYNPTNN